ncbi:MAG: FCD domain-containing protein [Burkholderiales bacterium]|nr:FCD domain-containing protein [Burkholderiales bacterium]
MKLLEDTQHSPLELVRQHSLTSALKGELERLIFNGEIKAGERLNETVLAARFRTSRGPVREALQALGEQGLVSFTRNRGAFIRRVSAEEALELYGIRAALEDQVGRQLAGRLSDEKAATLTTLLHEMDRTIRGHQVGEYYRLNLRFHDLLVQYAGSARLAEIYRRVIKELHLFRLHGLAHGAGLEMSTTEHRAIVEALQSGSASRASKAMRGHVEAALRRLQAALQAAAAA